MYVSTKESQVQLNQPEAFRAFYEEALPRVYTYFYYRCGGITPVAEDLSQETFLAAVAEIRKGKPVTAPVPWLLGIARHKLLDHYRRQKREERKLAVSWEAQPSDDRLLTWDREDSRERALAALRSVPAPQQAALVLRYLDGMSVPEVARALGKSVRAAESLLARGRESFKRFYMEEVGGG